MQKEFNVIYKSLLYRMVCIVVSMVIIYCLTTDIIKTTGIVMTLELIKTVIYYIFEKIWTNLVEEVDK